MDMNFDMSSVGFFNSINKAAQEGETAVSSAKFGVIADSTAPVGGFSAILEGKTITPEVVNSEAAFSAAELLSSEEGDLLHKIESLSEIDALLKRVSALLGLNVDMEKSLYQVDPEEVPEEMVSQLADFLAGLKEFSELLKGAAESGEVIEVNGMEIAGGEVSELADMLSQESLNLELQFAKLGITEKVAVELANIQNLEVKGSGIPVATNPADLPVAKLPKGLTDLIEQEESELESLIGSIRKIAVSTPKKEGGAAALSVLSRQGESVKEALNSVAALADDTAVKAEASVSVAEGKALSVGETPVVQGETPVAQGGTPVVQGETSVAQGETPVVQGETSVVLKEGVLTETVVEEISHAVQGETLPDDETEAVDGKAVVLSDAKSQIPEDAVILQKTETVKQAKVDTVTLQNAQAVQVEAQVSAENAGAEEGEGAVVESSDEVVVRDDARSEIPLGDMLDSDQETSDEGEGESQSETLFSQSNSGDVSSAVTGEEVEFATFDIDQEPLAAVEQTAKPTASRMHTPRTFEQLVMDQVSGKLADAVKEGSREVTIVLKPEMLGEVKLTIQMEGDLVAAKLQVESQQVKQIIEGNFQNLRDALAEHDLQAGSLDVNVGQGDEKRAEEQKTRRRRKTGHAGDLGEFTEEAFVEDFLGKETGRRFGNNSVEYFA